MVRFSCNSIQRIFGVCFVISLKIQKKPISTELWYYEKKQIFIFFKKSYRRFTFSSFRHNLQSSGLTWWIRAIILNVGYLVFLFFVTSPVIILNALGISNLYKNVRFTKKHQIVDGSHGDMLIFQILIVKQIIPALLLLELGFVIGSMTRFVTNKTRYHDK